MTKEEGRTVKALVRVFEGRTPDGMAVGLALTAGAATSPEALEDMNRLGVQALEHKYPGVRDVRPAGEWTEYELDLGD